MGISSSSVSSSERAGEARSGRAWEAAALAVLLLGLFSRVHNAVGIPPLWDWDAEGHALNVFALFEARLPDLSSWSGAHPPLYHLLVAISWHALPELVPVHVIMRLLSLAASTLTLWLVWRAMRARLPSADAAVTITLLAGIPVMATSMSMGTNETLCALFASATLARLARDPLGASGWQAAATGALAGLAALAKMTGLLAVAVGVLAHAFGKSVPLRKRTFLLGSFLLASVAIFAPHYARLLLDQERSAFAVSGARSPDMETFMKSQPPGRRQLSHYWRVPAATFTNPRAPSSAELLVSVTGLLHASAWSDAHARLVRLDEPHVRVARSTLACLGVIPMLLMALGLAHVLAKPSRRHALRFPLLFGAGLGAGFLWLTWTHPYFSWVQARYFLPGILVAGLLLGHGLVLFRQPWRQGVRALLLVVSVAGFGFTWGGWWLPRDPPSAAAAGSLVTGADCQSKLRPEGVVCRYMRGLQRDPIRTLALLDASFHERHGLRMMAAGPYAARPDVELARGRLGWLNTLQLPGVRRTLERVKMVGRRATVDGDRAEVVTQVLSTGGPPFPQIFTLRRAGSSWRITSISQPDVAPASLRAAFATAPSKGMAARMLELHTP